MKETIFFCIVGLPLFGTEGSGTPVFKILVRALLVVKKNTGFCQKRVQFGDFVPENFVCLTFSFSPLGANASEKRPIESAETGQNTFNQISIAQIGDAVVG